MVFSYVHINPRVRVIRVVMFEYVLIILALVLISAVLGQLIPKVSLPLVQIGLGLVLALILPQIQQVNVSSDLFLILFIAPLLFDESRRISTAAIWNNKGSIFSLAVGLVIVTLLAVGFALHLLVPSVPLAAAFALGAALGPTDAVAVSSLSDEVKLNGRQKTLLSGEALLNDASGVVSFNFAIAAAVTGAFSLLDATASFLITFLGGLGLGLLLGVLVKVGVDLVRSQGLENNTVHVLSELVTPFLIYLLAERVGVSGILAVVAAGLLLTIFPERTNPTSARLNVVSSSVWEVLVFLINGIVFLMLGMRLPIAIAPAADGDDIYLPLLLLAILVVTGISIGIRFLWLLAMEVRTQRSEAGRAVRLAHALSKQGLTPGSSAQHVQAERHMRQGEAVPTKTPVRDVLVTALSGPKGAVTLSIVFTIPMTLSNGAPFPHRDALIFLASGVIILTLLLANFVVPALAPKESGAESEVAGHDMRIKVYKQVITALRAQQTEETAPATAAVIRQYRDRIAHYREQDASNDLVNKLRTEVYARQAQVVEELLDRDLTSRAAATRYLKIIKRGRNLLSRGPIGSQLARSPWHHPWAAFTVVLSSLMHRTRKVDPKLNAEVRELAVEVEQASTLYLREKVESEDKAERRAARLLLEEHETALAAAQAQAKFNEGTMTMMRQAINPHLRVTNFRDYDRLVAHMNEVEAEGLRLELDAIQSLREEGAISRRVASEMREEVYVMQMDLNG